MTEMNINTNTYTAVSSASNTSVTLTPQDAIQSRLVIYNGATTAVYITSSFGSIPAVLPTAGASGQKPGKMYGPGAIMTFAKDVKHDTINLISVSAGTGNAWISPGTGN